MSNQYDDILFAQMFPYLALVKKKDACQKKIDDKKDFDNHKKSKNSKEPVVLTMSDNYRIRYAYIDESVNWETLISSEDCLVISAKEGFLHEGAGDFFVSCFKSNPEAVICYADEDYLGELSKDAQSRFSSAYLKNYQYKDTGLYQQEPWFKPEFSPDTLKSFFYFGNVFAININRCKELGFDLPGSLSVGDVHSWAVKLYEQTGDKRHFCHISEVLFTNKDMTAIDDLPDRWSVDIKPSGDTLPLVSIVIPSKDNPEVLCRCLESLLEKTLYTNYEVVIVDNGSNDDNKKWITDSINGLIKRHTCCIQYIYKKMPFNFSRMCNLGVEKSVGEYILLLNDDMEIIQGNWLETMLAQAQMRHTGAVGAKLYYPNSRIIQHVGITNMGVGPAHKLGGLEDNRNYYHGKNMVPYNTLAVTGACLMVKKDLYIKAGCMDEELTVAYNDVDFCFKLYEMGYYNVVRNDVVLYHYESLSRGQDDDDSKKERLFTEKTRLYEKHPELKAYDPFYHKELVQWKRDREYNCNFEYLYDSIQNIDIVSGLEEKLLNMRCLDKINRYVNRVIKGQLSMLQVDAIDREDEITIRGWHIIRECDNKRLDKYLILFDKESGKMYKVKAEKMMRLDVESALLQNSEGNTKNIALSGFWVKLNPDEIPAGEYEVGMLTCGINKAMNGVIRRGGKVWTRSSTVLKKN